MERTLLAVSVSFDKHRTSNLKFWIAVLLFVVIIYAISAKGREQSGEYNIDAREVFWMLIFIAIWLVHCLVAF